MNTAIRENISFTRPTHSFSQIFLEVSSSSPSFEAVLHIHERIIFIMSSFFKVWTASIESSRRGGE